MKRRNNNKKLKIIIGIIVFILALIATYIILIIKDILPNPLLDTSDLVCERINDFGEEEEYIFKFNNRAKVISYQRNTNIKFNDYDFAKEYYDEIKYKENIKFNEEEYSISTNFTFKIEENNVQLYNKTKEEVNELYTSYYNFDCK